MKYASILLAATAAGAGGTWPEAVGGYTTFLTADEEVATAMPRPNTLSLVLRPPAVMSFVKYVTAAAPGNRYDVALRFACADTAGDGDEGEDEGDEDEDDEGEGGDRGGE